MTADSPDGNGTVAASTMSAAIEARQRAADRLRSERREAQAACQRPVATRAAVNQADLTAEWQRTKPMLHLLLQAQHQLILHAVDGGLIVDRRQLCESRGFDANLYDIYIEVDNLFTICVRNNLCRVARKVFEANRKQQQVRWARAMLKDLLQLPFKTFTFIAHHLALAALAAASDDLRVSTRYFNGLQRTLMALADCYRYLLNHAKSRDAAELLRILAPAEGEAHMRLAMSLSFLDGTCASVRPFFHFCVFLANNRIQVGNSEAEVVARFVAQVTQPKMKTEKKANDDGIPDASSSPFHEQYIAALWALVHDERNERPAELVQSPTLWSSLNAYLTSSFCSRDLLCIIGGLMFAHHRAGPRGGRDKPLSLHSAVADDLACRLALTLSDAVLVSLRSAVAALRSRRKNRRRLLQKKRKANGAPVAVVTEENLGHFTLQTSLELDESVPVLPAFSFLCLYWSAARLAPRPGTDLHMMVALLRNLRTICIELENIAQITAMTTVCNHVRSKLQVCAGSKMPALDEDIMFFHFAPVCEWNLLDDVLLQQVPLSAVFESKSDDLVRTTLREMDDRTYESVVATSVKKHWDALCKLSIKETGVSTSYAHPDSVCKILVMTVRLNRIARLAKSLEKVAGLHSISIDDLNPLKTKAKDAEKQSDDDDDAELPQGAQVPQESSSLDAKVSSDAVHTMLKKRRRLMGPCTPALNGVADGEDARMSSCHDKHGAKPVVSCSKEAAQGRPSGIAQPMLAQGTLQLCLEKQPSQPKGQEVKKGRSLTECLMHHLYSGKLISPPRGLPSRPGRAFWRQFQADDFSRF